MLQLHLSDQKILWPAKVHPNIKGLTLLGITRMSHIKSCVALVYLTMAFLLLHMNITSSGLDISHTAIQITGLLNMDSPEERNLSTKTELLSKNANLHILLKQIAAELNAARARLTFSKHGKDSRANITKGTIRKVSAQTEELYFELVKTYTNSEFILVRANHKKLLGKYFSIAGNNCLEIKKNALRGIYSLERLNRTCTESMDSLLQNVGLQPNLLSVAMPGHKVHTSEESYLLTFLHIFKNAVVSPDGEKNWLVKQPVHSNRLGKTMIREKYQ